MSTRLFVAGLSHLDCAYLDPDNGLVGESWSVDVSVGGPLDEMGMICDFGIVKARLKQALDNFIDHKLILCEQDAIDIAESADTLEIVHADRIGRRLRYRAPAAAICRLDIPEGDPESLATALATRLRGELPDPIEELSISLTSPEHRGQFHYCHGLKKHDGNCQRMAHGHRGRLEIELDGRPAPWLESRWAQQLGYRFIGSEEDLRSAPSAGRQCFAYRSSQGEFELELPEDRVYVIAADATIECLSAHVARTVSKNHGGQTATASAYEGIGKGAISTAQA